MKKLFLVIPLLLACVACGPLDQTARNVIAAGAGSLRQAQKSFGPQCSADGSKPVCVAIHDGVQAENVAIDALETYCSGTPSGGNLDFNVGGPCSPVKGASDALQASLVDLATKLNDLKGFKP